MTEAELIESAQLAYGNGIGTYAIFWSMAGGYLVAMYLAAKELTTSQTVIVNTLFILATAISLFGSFVFFSVGFQFISELRQLNPNRGALAFENIGIISVIVNTVIVAACLKFQWDIRHAK